jgi:conjugal transfer mating pair stabilization protein TraG
MNEADASRTAPRRPGAVRAEQFGSAVAASSEGHRVPQRARVAFASDTHNVGGNVMVEGSAGKLDPRGHEQRSDPAAGQQPFERDF